MKNHLHNASWYQITLLLFVLLLSLGSFQRIPFSSLQSYLLFLPSGALYLHDLFILVWTVVVLADQSYRITLIKIIKKYWLLSLVFAWVGLATILYSSTLFSSGLLYFLRVVMYVLFAITLYMLQKKNNVHIAQALGLFFGTYTLTSLLFYFIFPDLRFLKILGWDDHFYRLSGTLLDPNFSGALFTLANIWIIKKFFKSKGKWRKRIFFLSSLISLIALALTFSRSSYLAWLVGAITTTWYFRNKLISWLYVPTGIILVLFTVLLTPKPGGEGVNLFRTSTIESRIQTIQEDTVQSKPNLQSLTGTGFYFDLPKQHPLYKNEQHAVFPDNVLILMYQSIGLLGICYVIFLIKHHWQHIRSSSVVWPYAVVILTHSMFNNTLLQPVVLLTFLLLIVYLKGLDSQSC